MKVNDILHGFKVTRVRESEELKGTLIEMEHIKTGALLAWLDNGCENKLFSATFKTLPWDDTGVFHILEHSVLAGSDNYPVKEPFLDLIKSSMNTFLNAMTFPDKTMYPVSSENEQDFINLTRVYLDAVFRPSIYHKDSIFRQEGWHYEVEDGEPFYNGVVFNEMKGAYASVETRIEHEIEKALFPDSIYGNISGGYPPAIPDLSYENFLKAHKEFYSPSNCRIFLDGTVPFDRVLTIIDEEYLSTFEKDDRVHEIKMQAPVPAKDITAYYEIGKDEDEGKKAHLVLGKIYADWQERKKIIAYTLMSIYLAGDNEAPLKRAILEKGLAQEVDFASMDGIAQAFYMLTFRNIDPSDKAEILKVYRDTLERILEEGIDKDALTGCINRFEFSLRESGEPQGLYRAVNAMNSWLYGGDPMLYLESNHLVKELRDDLDGSLYTDILKELLDQEGLVTITMLPSKTKGDEEAEAEHQRVTAEYGSFSPEELKEVEDIYERMRKWQDEPDSPEDKAKLPVLKISDVSPKPQWTEPQVIKKNGVTFLYEPIFTNGVAHVNMYFAVTDFTEEELQMASVLTEFIGLLPTKRHTAAELQKEKRILFGGLDYNIMAPWVKGHVDRAEPCFTVSFSVLEENLDPAIDFVLEILTETLYENADIIKENLLQCKEVIYQNVMGAGNQFAARRVLSNYAASSYIEEKVNGYDYYLFVKEILKDFDERSGALLKSWAELAGKIFTSARLLVGETSTERHDALERFSTELPAGTEVPEYMEISLAGEAKKEAILIPAGISFAALGGNMLKYDVTCGGRFQVLMQILSYGYLWDKIRVHGGAYGCGFSAGLTGNMVFTSYRDPNPMNSLKVYAESGDFIRDFAEGGESLDNYIISSIAGMDGLLTSAKKGFRQELSYIRGSSYDDLYEIRQQMLGLKMDELSELSDLFDQVGHDASICVVGNKEALELDDSWKVYNL